MDRQRNGRRKERERVARIKPEDIKVTVTYTEGYRERYTAACLKILERRRKQQEMEWKMGGIDYKDSQPAAG